MSRLKFALVVLTAVSVLVCVYGCFGKNREPDNASIPDVTLSESDSAAETDKSKLPAQTYKVEIKKENVSTEKLEAEMLYPKISGYVDSETEEKVNALVYSYVEGKMNTAVNAVNTPSGDEKIIYEAKSFEVTCKNEKIMSALCRGSIAYPIDASPVEFSFGINVDLENSKLIGFDSVVDFAQFKKSFINGDFSMTYGYEKLLDETNFTDLISQYDVLYSIYPEYYIRSFDGGYALGVVAETIPVLGYTAEFESDISKSSFTTKYINELLS